MTDDLAKLQHMAKKFSMTLRMKKDFEDAIRIFVSGMAELIIGLFLCLFNLAFIWPILIYECFRTVRE